VEGQASEIANPAARLLDNPAVSIERQLLPILIGGVGMVALARNHLQADRSLAFRFEVIA
jgi:hypothetical protein